MFNICRVSIKNGTLKHAASAGVLRWAAKTPRRTVNCCPANASAATSTSWSATPRRRPLRRRRAPQHRRPPRRPRCRPPFPKTIATSRNRRPERRSGPALRSTIFPRFFFCLEDCILHQTIEWKTPSRRLHGTIDVVEHECCVRARFSVESVGNGRMMTTADIIAGTTTPDGSDGGRPRIRRRRRRSQTPKAATRRCRARPQPDEPDALQRRALSRGRPAVHLQPVSCSLWPSFSGFYRVSPSYSEFYRIWPSFVEFYWIWPCFTEFYRVLSSFIEWSQLLSGFNYLSWPSFTEFRQLEPSFLYFLPGSQVRRGRCTCCTTRNSRRPSSRCSSRWPRRCRWWPTRSSTCSCWKCPASTSPRSPTR